MYVFLFLLAVICFAAAYLTHSEEMKCIYIAISLASLFYIFFIP